MAARETPAAGGGAAAAMRGPAVMAGLGGAAALAALSMAVPFQNVLPDWLERFADSWLVPALALIGFGLGYLLARKIARRAPPPDETAEDVAEVGTDVSGLFGEAAVPMTQAHGPANPLLAEPLARLGPVQLVERLAIAVGRNPPPARDTARAVQLSAQFSGLSAKLSGNLPASGMSDDVADTNRSALDEHRQFDERSRTG